VEADGDRFLVIRAPGVIELDAPDEMAMALAAAQEYFGPSYEVHDVLAGVSGLRRICGENPIVFQ